MKNSKVIRGLAVMSFVIALCAFGSQASYYLLPASSFMVMTCDGYGTSNNPNQFPVVIVSSNQLQNGNAGFLLNGSESSNNWLKMLQDACLNHRNIGVYTDDNWAHVYDGRISEVGYTAGAYKIVAIILVP
jgi:hypothetical protein